LVGTDSRRVQTGVTVEIANNSSNGQACADTGTCSQNVQITSSGVSIWIKILRVNRNAIGVLASGGLPIGESKFNSRVKDSDRAPGPGGIKIVVITGQPGRIGGSATDRDRHVRSASEVVAASVIENIIFEVARVVHHPAKEGECVRG
jgi:hypothetical protein